MQEPSLWLCRGDCAQGHPSREAKRAEGCPGAAELHRHFGGIELDLLGPSSSQWPGGSIPSITGLGYSVCLFLRACTHVCL